MPAVKGKLSNYSVNALTTVLRTASVAPVVTPNPPLHLSLALPHSLPLCCTRPLVTWAAMGGLVWGQHMSSPRVAFAFALRLCVTVGNEAATLLAAHRALPGGCNPQFVNHWVNYSSLLVSLLAFPANCINYNCTLRTKYTNHWCPVSSAGGWRWHRHLHHHLFVGSQGLRHTGQVPYTRETMWWWAMCAQPLMPLVIPEAVRWWWKAGNCFWLRYWK